jgi:hypothetical protein
VKKLWFMGVVGFGIVGPHGWECGRRRRCQDGDEKWDG